MFECKQLNFQEVQMDSLSEICPREVGAAGVSGNERSPATPRLIAPLRPPQHFRT